MGPLSHDLRERVVAAIDHHEGSRREIARRFRVSVSSLTRLLPLRRETGSLDPGPHGGGQPPALDRDGLERLRRLVEERPDATLQELQGHPGVGGGVTIAWRASRRLGITREKKARQADERGGPDVRKERHRPAGRSSRSRPDGWPSWTRRG